MNSFKNKLLSFVLSSVFLFSSCSLIPQAPSEGGSGHNTSGGGGEVIEEEKYYANVNGNDYLMRFSASSPLYDTYTVTIEYIERRTWVYFTSNKKGQLTVSAMNSKNNLYPLDYAQSHGYLITYDSGFYLTLSLTVYHEGWYDAYLTGYKDDKFNICLNSSIYEMERKKLYNESYDINEIYFFQLPYPIDSLYDIQIYDQKTSELIPISMNGYTDSFHGDDTSSEYHYKLHPSFNFDTSTNIYLIISGQFYYLSTHLYY